MNESCRVGQERLMIMLFSTGQINEQYYRNEVRHAGISPGRKTQILEELLSIVGTHVFTVDEGWVYTKKIGIF